MRIYELGVRHALRPFSTVVIAESKLQYPFDVNHTAILSYQHLGDAIDYDEVVRFRQELKKIVAAVVANQKKDSPVYTYLPSLTPPAASARAAGFAEGRSRNRHRHDHACNLPPSSLRGRTPRSRPAIS